MIMNYIKQQSIKHTKSLCSLLVSSFSSWHNFIIVLNTRKQTVLFSDKDKFSRTLKNPLCVLTVFKTANNVITKHLLLHIIY